MSFNDGVVILSPADALFIAEILTAAGDNHHQTRAAIDDGGLKLSVNQGIWTPPIGHPERD